MNTRTLRLLFAFSHWANTHTITLLGQLPDDVIRADSSRFYSGSAWTMLRHLLDVEWSWMRCCQGLSMTEYLWDLMPFENVEQALAVMSEEYPRVQAYVASLTLEDLAAPVEIGLIRDEPSMLRSRGDLLAHILNHGTEHRSDLAHFLTDHGLSPGDLDYLDFLAAVDQMSA